MTRACSLFALALSCLFDRSHGVRRIIGGDDTEDAIPWMASLEAPDQLGRMQHYCGATLISPSWLVTAAHCLYGKDFLNEMHALIGGLDREEVEKFDQRRFHKIYIHEEYKEYLHLNDIALIQLADPSTMSPIKINADKTDKAVGQRATILGWGMTEMDGTLSNELMEADLPIVSDEDCQEAMGTLDSKTQLCAGYTNGGVDACQGDSGGPLVGKLGGSLVDALLAGVVSWGDGCAMPGKYGIYMAIDQYIGWMCGKMRGAPLNLISPTGARVNKTYCNGNYTVAGHSSYTSDVMEDVDDAPEEPETYETITWVLVAGCVLGILVLGTGVAVYVSGRRKKRRLLTILQESTVELGIDLSTAMKLVFEAAAEAKEAHQQQRNESGDTDAVEAREAMEIEERSNSLDQDVETQDVRQDSAAQKESEAQ